MSIFRKPSSAPDVKIADPVASRQYNGARIISSSQWATTVANTPNGTNVDVRVRSLSTLFERDSKLIESLSPAIE